MIICCSLFTVMGTGVQLVEHCIHVPMGCRNLNLWLDLWHCIKVLLTNRVLSVGKVDCLLQSPLEWTHPSSLWAKEKVSHVCPHLTLTAYSWSEIPQLWSRLNTSATTLKNYSVFNWNSYFLMGCVVFLHMCLIWRWLNNGVRSRYPSDEFVTRWWAGKNC